MSTHFTCPNCGADVPLKARACPECGSDKETGWSEAAQYIHLLPDRGDSGIANSKFKTWQKLAIAITAVIVIIAFLLAQGFTWSLYVVPVAALIAGITYFLTRQPSSTDRSLERQLYQQLLSRSGGNRNLAERLMELERQRHPDANRLQLLQNAIYRWDRDRR
jgi:RNA polymerase subunit RPABC4/transcription elongation factor Spt4